MAKKKKGKKNRGNQLVSLDFLLLKPDRKISLKNITGFPYLQ